LIALVGKVLENHSADKHYHSIEESDSEEALTALRCSPLVAREIRAAADLRQSVEKVQDYACELNETLSAEQWQQLVATSQKAVHCATSQPKFNPFEQSGREEAIECWLDSHKIADAWDLAPALVSARVDEATLETVKRTVPAQDLENAIQWLAANLTTRDLLKSISHSTERISELVSAVKSYSFMDQAPWQEIDVHEGIENTLIILGHKLRNVTVSRDFDRTLPRLCAYGGELNQVWTNLIDNAIYAVGGTGRIDVRTRRDGEFFLVEIADNGRGIPPEARPHILRCPSSQPRATPARDSAWLSATGSSSNGITEKSTSARVPMARNLLCGCRLNRLRTLSPLAHSPPGC
jgi:signal transduction histidine kinase